MLNWKNALTLLLLAGAVTAGLLLPGCLEDGAACEASCEEDKDCGSGLLCLYGTCLPKACDDCYDSGRSCRYDGPAESGMCEYIGCG